VNESCSSAAGACSDVRAFLVVVLKATPPAKGVTVTGTPASKCIACFDHSNDIA
jgi:hypothetical protein